MIYLERTYNGEIFGAGREFLLSDGFFVLEHWIIHNEEEVRADGPLKDKPWSPELVKEIGDNPKWKPTTEAMPLVKLIALLRGM